MRRRLAALIGAAVLAMATPAAADDTPTTTAPPVATTVAEAPPETPPTTADQQLDLASDEDGIGGMLPQSNARGDNDPTLAEKYPPSAYEWTSDYGAKDWLTGRGIGNSIAEAGLTVLVTGGTIVTRLTSWVFSAPVVGTDAVERFVRNVMAGIFLPYAVGILTALGVYVVWLGLRNRALEAIQHVLWCCAVVLMCLAVAWAPGTIIRTLNAGTLKLSRATLAGASVVTPDTNGSPHSTTRGTFRGDPADAAIRQTVDTWWQLFVYEPWLWGEVGNPNKTPGAGETILAFKSASPLSLTPEEAAIVAEPNKPVRDGGKCDFRAGWDYVRCQRSHGFTTYRDKTLESIPGVGSWVNGKHSWERAGIAWLAVLAAAVSGTVLLVLAIASVYWSYAAMIRIAAVPLAGLRGMSPKNGQAMFVGYLAQTAGTYLKRIGATLVLALAMVAASTVAQLFASVSWFVLAVSQVIALFAVIVLVVQQLRHEGKLKVPGVVKAGGKFAANALLAGEGGLIAGLAARRAQRGPTGAARGWDPANIPDPGPNESGIGTAMAMREQARRAGGGAPARRVNVTMV